MKGTRKKESYDEEFMSNTALSRMKTCGYSKDEVKVFQKAMYEHDDKLLDSLPCRCTALYKCEVCSIKDLTKKLSILSPGKKTRQKTRTREDEILSHLKYKEKKKRKMI